MDIPIIVVCYNNCKYVENTLKQIQKINPCYYSNIQIMDNCSTCEDTIDFLKNTDVTVIRRIKNDGPWISCKCNKDIYDSLPSKFILTDPDLEFNKNLPRNFIDDLVKLSDKYNTLKIGFALDITDYDKMFQTNDYCQGKNIYDWESQFLTNKIEDEDYQLYEAIIDTTFCLINKQYSDKNIRVSGNFTARHLPWYIDNIQFNIYESYILYSKQTNISTIKKSFHKYVDDMFLKINKNDELFLIPKSYNWDIRFCENSNCKDEIFVILDRYLDKSKICIDVGSHAGTTALYAARKSKHIYCIEADKQSFNELSENIKNNCKHNYTLVNKEIYANDTMSIIDTIYDNDINTDDISIMNVYIEGEENILNQLYSYHIKYNINLCISFHYDTWVNKNLDRFEFLTEKQKTYITTNPFGSIVFERLTTTLSI